MKHVAAMLIALDASRSFLHRLSFFTEDTPTAVLVRQVLGAIAHSRRRSRCCETGSGS
jgi:hypothetical protein